MRYMWKQKLADKEQSLHHQYYKCYFLCKERKKKKKKKETADLKTISIQQHIK